MPGVPRLGTPTSAPITLTTAVVKGLTSTLLLSPFKLGRYVVKEAFPVITVMIYGPPLGTFGTEYVLPVKGVPGAFRRAPVWS